MYYKKTINLRKCGVLNNKRHHEMSLVVYTHTLAKDHPQGRKDGRTRCYNAIICPSFISSSPFLCNHLILASHGVAGRGELKKKLSRRLIVSQGQKSPSKDLNNLG